MDEEATEGVVLSTTIRFNYFFFFLLYVVQHGCTPLTMKYTNKTNERVCAHR